MKKCVYDIEGNQLLVRCTTIHCMVIQDLQTGEVFQYRPGQIVQGYKKLLEYDACYGHNVFGYDKPVLQKLIGQPNNLSRLPLHHDTLVMSRMLYGPGDECPAGGHGLGDWGQYLNQKKLQFHQFSVFTEQMLVYNTQDVDTNVALLNYLKKRWDKNLNYGYKLQCNIAAIIAQQQLNGFTLNTNKLHKLIRFLDIEKAAARDVIDRIIPPTTFQMKTPEYWVASQDQAPLFGQTKPQQVRFKTKGQAVKAGYKPKNIRQGPLKTQTKRFNPDSGPQIQSLLVQRHNWKPTVLTKKGNPSTSGKVLQNLSYPQIQPILEYQAITKRLSQVTSWQQFLINGRVHGGVNSLGTVTFRMSHSNPNIAQVTAKGKKYGAQCRQCWQAGQGKILVGTDAKGLQLRMLANALAPYDGGQYIPVVVQGDPHQYNDTMLGIGNRSATKVIVYGVFYGQGLLATGKLAKDCKDLFPDARKKKVPDGYLRYLEQQGALTEENKWYVQLGMVVQQRLKNNIKGMRQLMNVLESQVKAKQYVTGIDGRRIPVTSMHTVLNRRLQSDGAIVMKQALRIHYVDSYRTQGKHGINWGYCANIHDQFQVECLPDRVQAFKKRGEDSIRLAGQKLKLYCPLAGDSNEGKCWLDTH